MKRNSELIPFLAASDLFGSLGTSALTPIANICQIYTYQKQEIITQIDTRLDGVYIVKAGQVIVQNQSRLRHQYLSAIITPGMCFGITSMIPNATAIGNSMALTTVKIIYIPKEKLTALYTQHPEIATCISIAFFDYLKRLMKLLMLTQTPSIKGRLATWLLEQPLIQPANKATRLVRIPVNKAQLARKLSIRPATLSRAMADLREAGAIAVSNKIIELKNIQKLESYIIGNNTSKTTAQPRN